MGTERRHGESDAGCQSRKARHRLSVTDSQTWNSKIRRVGHGEPVTGSQAQEDVRRESNTERGGESDS